MQSRKSDIAAIVMPTVAMTGPTIDPIRTHTTIIGPTTTIPGGVAASMKVNDCCNVSLANPSCLAGEWQHHKGRMKMRRVLWTFTILAVATAFTGPVFAGLKDAKNKSECEKAGGVWIEKDNK